MKDSDSNNPTPAELEILQVLWKEGPSTVRQVHDHLSGRKEVVYTTILKIMQLMLEKEMVSREAQGRGHLYTAVVQEEAAQSALLDRFLKKTFGGSALKLVMKALGNYQASADELQELKQYIQSIEDQETPKGD